MRAVAIFCAALALSGCVGPLDPMCYPDSCWTMLLSDAASGQENGRSVDAAGERR